MKHLEKISDVKIPTVEIPTGMPLVYELDDNMILPETLLFEIILVSPADSTATSFLRVHSFRKAQHTASHYDAGHYW